MAGTARAPRARSLDDRLEGMPGYRAADGIAGITGLFLAVGRAAVRLPWTWQRDFVAEVATGLRRALIPVVISSAFFSLGLFGIYFGGVVESLGTLERAGGGAAAGFMREVALWIAMMIVAGAVGSSITADLAARKVREELDALAVLGIDHVRTLVVPRALALVVVMPAIGMISLLVCHVVALVAANAFFPESVSYAGFVETYWAFVYGPDLLLYLTKLLLTGAFVGVVACHKGLTSGVGTEGVGRAVNQSVLITFAGVWIIHLLLNFIFFSVFPEVLVLRG